MREWVFYYVEKDPLFGIIVIILIILNTIFLALEHESQPESMTKILNIGNTVFTILFAVEMLIKLFALGVKGYVSDNFNIFDGVIVIVSMLEFVNINSNFITVLRAFRLLRIFKLVRKWKKLKQLLKTVIDSFSAIANLGLLMFLLLFIYALIGMQFFSGPLLDSEGEVARYNFNSFGWSLITIFIILTGENWNEVMFVVINTYGSASSLYFVSLIIFGNFMILNLFLAILLKFIADNVTEEQMKQEENNANQSGEELVAQVIREKSRPAVAGEQDSQASPPR